MNHSNVSFTLKNTVICTKTQIHTIYDPSMWAGILLKHAQLTSSVTRGKAEFRQL